MLKHLKSFVRYCTTSQCVEIASHYDAEGSLSRILELDSRGEIRVWEAKKNKLMAAGAQWSRSNVLQVFKGQLEERAGRIFLKGTIGIDPGIRVVIGFFCFVIFIFFPLRLGALLGGTYVPGHVPYFVGPLCFLGLLTFLYFGGRNDAAKILRNLTRVLAEDHTT
jgi:hypothetical protein